MLFNVRFFFCLLFALPLVFTGCGVGNSAHQPLVIISSPQENARLSMNQVIHIHGYVYDNNAINTLNLSLIPVESQEAVTTATVPVDHLGNWQYSFIPVASGVNAGDYQLQASITDNAGHIASASKKITITFTPVPDDIGIAITLHPETTTNHRQATFGFIADDKTATFSCSLDGSPFNACQTPQNYSLLTLGQHEFVVRASNAQGKSGEAIFRWTILNYGITTGLHHTCFLSQAGEAFCWGRNTDGALGISILDSFATPQLIDYPLLTGKKWLTLNANLSYTCGIRDDGSAWCWGSNFDGKLGNGNDFNAAVPQLILDNNISGEYWRDIDGGSNHTCGIRDDGTAWCWGDNSYGQLGNNTNIDSNIPVAVATENLTGLTWVLISPGYQYSCGIRDDGTAWCWGSNNSGQLGNNLPQNAATPTPVATNGVSGSIWLTLNTGQSHTCGIRDDGTAWCWGQNNEGALGDATFNDSSVPTAVGTDNLSGNNWLTVAVGLDKTCGLRDDHSAWCWGDNYLGALGTLDIAPGNTTPNPVQVDVASIASWQQLDVMSSHSCGVATDQTLWCWGSNSYGQLGTGFFGNQNTPQPISSTLTWQTISTGWGSCGQTTQNDNTNVYCWGYNIFGQLGNGNTTDQPLPDLVNSGMVSGTTWAKIVANTDHSCGIRDDGTAWCWGDNTSGQLGNGDIQGQLTPVLVDTNNISGNIWLDIDVNSNYSCGIRDDGTAWCWGRGFFGQLGNGNNGMNTNESLPVAIDLTNVSGNAWTTLALGSLHACGIRDDGSAWCWGSNLYGNLGTGNTTLSSIPVAVLSNNTSGQAWTNIVTGNRHTAVSVTMAPLGVGALMTMATSVVGQKGMKAAYPWLLMLTKLAAIFGNR